MIECRSKVRYQQINELMKSHTPLRREQRPDALELQQGRRYYHSSRFAYRYLKSGVRSCRLAENYEREHRDALEGLVPRTVESSLGWSGGLLEGAAEEQSCRYPSCAAWFGLYQARPRGVPAAMKLHGLLQTEGL